jgi:RNA polymerase sigma factor (sigma-70 family)
MTETKQIHMKQSHIDMNYKTTTDERFVARDGSAVRYQEIFEGIDRTVRSLGRRMSREDREDLFQDAALGVIRSRAGYDPGLGHRCPQAYGSKAARNCAKDAFARAARRNAAFTTLEVRDEDGEARLPVRISGYRGDEYEADRALETSEATAYIEERILSLNERYRTVIALQRQGLRPRHMAAILGCTPSVASLTLLRARRALARALGADFLSAYGLCA